MVLGGIKRIAWATKLLLTAVWASLVDCISLCRILNCFLSSMGALTHLRLPTHPQLPQAPPTAHSL